MKKDPDALMFRDLPVWLQDVLRELSRGGFIYIGRTGAGQGMSAILRPPSKSVYYGGHF